MTDQPLPAGLCREWLGLDPADLRHPRRVLGLLPSESDPLVVLEAAKARITLLRGLEVGALEPVRRALLDRVETAREEVLAEIAASGRAAPTPVPRRPPAAFRMPPPPPGAGVPRDPREAAAAPRTRDAAAPPGAWRAEAPAEPHGELPEHAEQGAVIAPIRLRAPPPRRRSGLPAVWLVGFLCLLTLAGLLGWLTWERNMSARQRREIARTKPADGQGDDEPGKAAMPPSERTAQAAHAPSDGSGSVLESMIPAAGTGSPAVGTGSPPPPSTLSQPNEPIAPAAAAAVPPAPDPTTAPTSPTPDEPSPPGEPPPDPTPPAEGDAAAMQPAGTTPLPGPFDDSAPGDPLAPHLSKARGALAERDFDAADDAIRAAAAAARGEEAVARVEAWQQLLHYSKGFAAYREQALATVTAGQEYDIDGKKVAVVEIDDKKFIYRATGKNTTVPRDRIPGKIVMAIVTGWFDDKPENELFIGAYHATKPEPDAGKARACWEAAAALGIEAGPLLGLLDDPALLTTPAER
jgi:hypothetical protein